MPLFKKIVQLLLLVGALVTLPAVSWSQDQNTSGPDGKAREEARAAITKKLDAFAEGGSEAEALVQWMKRLTLVTLVIKAADGRATIERIHPTDEVTEVVLIVTCENDRKQVGLSDIFALPVVGSITYPTKGGTTIPVPIAFLRHDMVFQDKVQALAQLQLLFDCRSLAEGKDGVSATVLAQEFAHREIRRITGSAYEPAYKALKDAMEANRIDARRREGAYERLTSYRKVLDPIFKKFGARLNDGEKDLILDQMYLSVCFDVVDQGSAALGERLAIKHQFIQDMAQSK